ETLGAADDELSSELYLELCESMAQKAYNQYEISNFAKNGFESQHNLKYWRCGEYLGLGCAAHSFYRGERYYHPRNIEDYIKNQTVIPDGKGGGTEEYVMLGLRLSKGIDTAKIAPISDDFLRTVGDLCKAGLANFDGRFLSLTRRGFLVSNSIISALLERIR
ncbi:MAG: coproporphyrinogen III oxidase family protein, partial [Clostridia bacterium]|nr:coproporphyrinogen III oxidase family protein [Clostridia bacterium]